MRRPVKPFVTEYKATNRRPGARGGGDDLFGHQAGEHAARETGAREESAYEAAMKAADALFSPAADRDSPKQSVLPANETMLADGSVPSGRILQAIEAARAEPDDAESEEAPRKRGRKPGSKNRPKPVTAAPAHEALALASNTSPDVHAAEVGSAEAATASVPARASVPYRPRSTDRFPWVRTKLKPGENWKRRLPKVCW